MKSKFDEDVLQLFVYMVCSDDQHVYRYCLGPRQTSKASIPAQRQSVLLLRKQATGLG